MTRSQAIEAALRELMSLPVAQRELAFLDRGIGTATANSVWLRARAALAMPEQGGAKQPKPFSSLLSILDRWKWREQQRPAAEARAIRECREEIRGFLVEGVADVCASVRAEEEANSPNSSESCARALRDLGAGGGKA